MASSGKRRRGDGGGEDERVEPQLSGSSRRGRRSVTPEPKGRGREAVRSGRAGFRYFAWALAISVWALLVLSLAIAYVWLSLDQKGLLRIPDREPGMMLLAADGQVLAERGAFYGDDVRIDELPVYVPQALIAIEDRRFYSHFGIDPLGMMRAMVTNLRSGRVVQGGSTLTQQLAKNLFLEPDRTFKRKLQEAALALWLEMHFTKDEILQLYLNRVYYGLGATGIEKAAQRYFGHSARELTLPEAASLAALLKAPTYYNPVKHPKESAERTAQVLDSMADAGFISQDEAEAAKNAPLKLKANGDYLPATQYIVDWISEQIPDLIGKVDQSIVIETTIDRTIQDDAEKAIRGRIQKDGAKLKVSQAAAVVLAPDGSVAAMVGGRSYVKSQFNRAIKAKRQPGSSFKPFLYLTALEQGRTPETTVIDEPVSIGGWVPENYKRRYLGPVTLTEALALSLNTVAAKLGAEVGPDNVIATARRLGITSDLQSNASIALGTSEVSVLEMATAFSPFANGGMGVVPHVVKRILTRDGTVLYERHGNGIGRVIPQPELGPMNYMMREVVLSGTGKPAAIPGQDIAGKTGTSQDYRDAWFIGYSAYYVCAIWAGNDDNSPTNKVTGGTLPASIFRDIMTPAHRNRAYAALPGFYTPGSYGPDIMAGAGVPGETSGNIAEPQQPQRRSSDGGILMGVLRSIFGSRAAPPPPPPQYQPLPLPPPPQAYQPDGAAPADAAPEAVPLPPLPPAPADPGVPAAAPDASGDQLLLDKLQRRLNSQP